MTAPVLLWQLWGFVTPGLHRREKQYAVPFIVASVTLFTGGAAICWLALPHAIQFLGTIGGQVQPFYTADKYLGLLLAMMLVFGISFEFPVVLVGLELVGVITPRSLSKRRRWAIILIVLGAAIITPSGDPLSMLALSVPLYVFYEGSILIGKLLGK